MKNIAAAALAMAALAVGIAACSPGAAPRPKLEGGVSATCRLFWTYQSAHGISPYPSFDAAYKADTAEYGHPATPGYVYDIMPVLTPWVTVTARSDVNIQFVEVEFYDKSGAKTNHNDQVLVKRALASGQSYSKYSWWGLSDPETGDTNVASCAVTAWTPRGTGGS